MARVILIFLVALIAYGNGFSGDWYFDDTHSILDNPHIRSLANIPSFFTDPSMFSANPQWGMYRPVLLVNYALTYWLVKYDFFWWQAINIILHALNACLLYWVALKLDRRLALWGALLFAVHPLASEPVNYICSRSDLLCGTFTFLFMGTLLNRKVWRFSEVLKPVTAFSLGMLTKAALAPLAIIPIYRELCGTNRRTLYNWLYLAIVVLFVWQIADNGHLSQSFTHNPRSWVEQVKVQFVVVAYHAWYLLIPYPLSIEHVVTTERVWVTVAGWWVIFAVAWSFYAFPDKRPYLLWVVLPLVLLAVVPLNVLMAERRLYLSLAPLCLLLAHLPRKALVPLAVVFLLLTWQRNDVWSTPEKLWTDTVEKSPNSSRGNLELGMVYVKRSLAGELQWDKAEELFKKSMDLDVTGVIRPRAMNNLSACYLQTGRLDEAGELLRALEATAPEEVGVQANLGIWYWMKGDLILAEQYLRMATVIEPYNVPVWQNLASVYVKLGNREKANWAHQHVANYSR